MSKKEINTHVVVIGSGPAGYSAAFRCSDLGLKTLLIEKNNFLGGVCLNVGCIPSKSLLYIAKIIKETKNISNYGVKFEKCKIDINKINNWKKNVILKLNNGLKNLSNKKKIKIIYGNAKFINNKKIKVKQNNKYIYINFNYAIISTGSKPAKLPLITYKNKRIWNSTEALKIPYIPKRLLIIGGGIIGLEIATIYSSLGSKKINIIENSEQILPFLDKDVINMYQKESNKYFSIMLNSFISKIMLNKKNISVIIRKKNNSLKIEKEYDAILVSIGRVPSINIIKNSNLNIKIKNNFVKVNNQMCTNISNIYAVGDITGNPMLAHKAIHQGRLAAEVISGKKHFFTPKVIPSVAYTDPEIAWVGITEKEAIKNKISYKTSTINWNMCGKAISSNNTNGLTKLIFDTNNRIIGGLIVGHNAGEIISEISIAIEMCCDAEDISLTIHPHPTLNETIRMAADLYQKTSTDI
ncbi:dihydrolipoyl dehydrogenase [Buchnera aphidicola (Taiwanaphis decaspermi)]|uniref:dihydrolipoyl dehydrogenase n=1 Tax=Buchnera aphidicola TaxID=9 RepID=UPI0031B7EDAC